MSLSEIKLSASAEKLAEQLSLDKGQLVGLIGDILEVTREHGLDLAGNIVCGLDVNGPVVDCDDSELLARELYSMGFSRLFVYKGGFEEWENSGMPVEKGIPGELGD